MSTIILPNDAEVREALGRPSTWPEASIVGQPQDERKVKEPRLLVKRNIPDLRGLNDTELIYLPGLPTISIFTGIGGFDIGTEQAGFCTVVQHERDKTCCQTLIANRPDFFRHSALIQGDIRETPTSMILKAGGLRVGEAHLLTGGPPCQGFSNAGKREVKDLRNTLVYEYIRVVREAQPRFFLMENVPGFLSLAKGRFFEAFLRQAYESYYELVYGLMDACEHGVPQYRCRFFCVGTRRDVHECDGMLGSLPEPRCFAPSDLKYVKMLERRPLFEHELELFRHAPGIRYFPDRPVLVPPQPLKNKEGADGWCTRSKTFIEFFRKLHRDEPDRVIFEPAGGEE